MNVVWIINRYGNITGKLAMIFILNKYRRDYQETIP